MISKDDYGSSYSCDCNIMQTCPVEMQGIPQMDQVMGAQEWHIVPLLGDVTSPTTAVPCGRMTSELRILSTEKNWPMSRQHTMYTNKS